MKFINKNISFDFDKTLQREDIQNLARALSRNNTIWIITRRFIYESDDVYEIARNLGIPRTRVIFTNGRWKYEKLKSMNIDYHYDDKQDEVNMINKWTSTRGIKI